MASSFVPAIFGHWVSDAVSNRIAIFNCCFVSILTGVLIYSIHSPNKKPIKLFGTNVEQFKSFAMDIKSGKYPNLTCIPPGIVDSVRLMIHYNPELRPNLHELPKVKVHSDFHRSRDPIEYNRIDLSCRFHTLTISA